MWGKGCPETAETPPEPEDEELSPISAWSTSSSELRLASAPS